MLFRPSFCANCGEKIERSEYGILTSRRFCEVCATEFMGHEMVPRVIVGIGVLTGIFGFGSYLKSDSVAETQALRQPRQFVEQPVASKQLPAANTVQSSVAQTIPVTGPANTQPVAADKLPNGSPAAKPKTVIDEPVYYCGAETKKGTPCSRRVKGNVRCFQHAGMPSIASAEKLSIR